MRRRLALALLLVASPAMAAPTASEKETARVLFKEGKDARAAGDHEAALQKFKAAHALAATPITALELAREYALARRLVEGRELALSVARIPVGASESERATQARSDAAALAEELKGRIASLVVRPSLADARVTVDGIALAPDATGAAQRLDPGKHVVAAHVDGGPETRMEVELAEGQTRELAIAVTAAPARPAPAQEPASPPRSQTNPLAWVGVGIGAVGLATGAVTGFAALSKSNTDACVGTRCTPPGIDDIETGRTLAAVSTVAFVVAAVGTGLAIYGFMKPVRPRTGMWMTPAGVAGSF